MLHTDVLLSSMANINGRRSISCVRSCLSHDSYLIGIVANYTVVHARSQSFLGHDVLFCAHRYICLLTSVLG